MVNRNGTVIILLKFNHFDFITSGLDHAFTLVSAGSGVETYPLLNKMPASTMSPAQIVDNLTRTLYEVSCKADALLKSPKPKSDASALASSAPSTSSSVGGLTTIGVFAPGDAAAAAQQDLCRLEDKDTGCGLWLAQNKTP
jgi:hypothetical protein